jgi:glyoxylate reductase
VSGDKPRVYVTRIIPEEGFQLVRDATRWSVWEEDCPVPREVLLQEAARVEGLLCLLTDQIDGELLDAAPGLRVVANMAVGYDNVDVDAATARGVPVTNTPGVLTETTADLAWALLMAAARRVVESDRFTREGRWKTWSPMLLLGQDIHHATLGIVGLGRIGAEVAKRGRGFDMRLLYASRSRKPELEQALGLEHVSLDDLLRQSDFVSIHTPLTEETRGLIGARELALMKRTAILINSARGPIVDQRALTEALTARRIGGAALDVFEEEPIAPDDPLLKLDNVVVLPHIGSATTATRGKMARIAAENLLAALAGQRPPNLVNTAVWRT